MQALVAIVAALGVLSFGSASGASAEGLTQTQINIATQLPDTLAQGQAMTLVGQVTTDPAGAVPLAPLTISIADGAPIGETTADQAGNFQLPFVVPADAPLGLQMLRIWFPGDMNFAPAMVELEANFSAPQVSMVITAQADTDAAEPGQTFTITGSTRQSDGAPLAGLTVYATAGTLENRTAAVESDANGNFSLQMTMAQGTASGPVAIQVICDGTDGIDPPGPAIAGAATEIPFNVLPGPVVPAPAQPDGSDRALPETPPYLFAMIAIAAVVVGAILIVVIVMAKRNSGRRPDETSHLA